MAVAPLNLRRAEPATPGATALPKRETGIGTLNQADFLKILTAQLQNQDPTEPTDNAQFVSQMAQFSTVNGIEQLNASLKALTDRLFPGPPAPSAVAAAPAAAAPAAPAAAAPAGGAR
ncbi:MAG: flagellar hook capping FlgD N-terminal domain-containing protein [Sphingomonadaceae bacterium]|nr:flagellar hook capping FlgD N-terminal domain-containing protein [Sphingomonadaceae bacterium]